MRSEDFKDVMVYVIMCIVITTFIICTAISAISENNSKERIRDMEIQLEMMQLEYKKPAEPEQKPDSAGQTIWRNYFPDPNDEE